MNGDNLATSIMQPLFVNITIFDGNDPLRWDLKLSNGKTSKYFLTWLILLHAWHVVLIKSGP